MLDAARAARVPVEALMMGAIQFQSEVEQLRHTIRFGLNNAGELLAEKFNAGVIEWKWNSHWLVEGPCKYGHVFQVFRSKGIDLAPIMNSELGAMKLAVEAGFISNRTYAECAETYGIRANATNQVTF
jgi:hypothetical protein